MQFSDVESAIEFLINLLMVFSQRIDVARHSNMMNAGVPQDDQNGTIPRWPTFEVPPGTLGVELECFALYRCRRCTTREFPNWNRFKFDVVKYINHVTQR